MGKQWKQCQTLFLGGSKITADGDCSCEIKRRLLLGRKFMTNLASILKSRDITLPTKVCLVKAMVFPVVMYGCESCTVKKAECQRIDAFELWCWRRLLRVPWTARTPNQQRRSALAFLWREWCWSWNSSTLATSCEELTHWKILWCWEGLGSGGEGDNTGWDGWMASLTQWTWVWVNSRSWWWTGRPGVLQFMRSQRVGHDWATELNWTELNWKCHSFHWSPHFRYSLITIYGHLRNKLCDCFQTTKIKWVSQKWESHGFFGFPVHIKVMFTLYSSLLTPQ